MSQLGTRGELTRKVPRYLMRLGLVLVALGFLGCIPLGLALSELITGSRFSPPTDRQLLITGFAGLGSAIFGTVVFRLSREAERRRAPAGGQVPPTAD